MSLPEDWDTLMQRFEKKLRHQMRKDRLVAHSNGFRLDVVDSESGLETVMSLHQQLWNARGLPGVFSSAQFTRFHRELSAKLARHGQVRFFILHYENEPIAGLYVFVYGNKAFFYQSGFVPGGPVHSPGTLIRNLAVEQAILEGLREWDFLKTEPGSYKHRWSSNSRQIFQARIARTHFKEAVYTSSHRVVDGLRQVKRSLKR